MTPSSRARLPPSQRLRERDVGVAGESRDRRDSSRSFASTKRFEPFAALAQRLARRTSCGPRRAGRRARRMPASLARAGARGSRRDGCAAAARRNPRPSPSATSSSPSMTNCCAAALWQRLDDLGEVARQRFAGFRLQLDVAAVAKGDAAKAVPLRLVASSRRLPGMRATVRVSIGSIGGRSSSDSNAARAPVRKLREIEAPAAAQQRLPQVADFARRARGTLKIVKSPVSQPASISSHVDRRRDGGRFVGPHRVDRGERLAERVLVVVHEHAARRPLCDAVLAVRTSGCALAI